MIEYGERMGLTDSLLGTITQKFGISGSQAQTVLDKAMPFLKDHLGGLSLPALPSFGGDASHPDAAAHGAQLMTNVPADAHAAHVADVAQSTGVHPDTVKAMLPLRAAGLHGGGHL